MKYKVGTQIPEGDILRRYKDEDGDILVEIRGVKDLLFRVIKGNQVYYTIDKSLIDEEELILVDDFASIDIPELDMDGETKGIFDQENQLDTDQNSGTRDAAEFDDFGGETITSEAEFDPSELKDQLEEGQQVPQYLIPKCKPNDYGGYTLRYEGFLYMISQKYIVEVKKEDPSSMYNLEDETVLMTPGEPLVNLDKVPTDPKRQEFEKGDLLPHQLRDQCEKDMGPGGGNRINIGNYLYHLDADFRVKVKMKVSYFEESPSVLASIDLPDDEPDKKEPEEPPKSSIPAREILSNTIINVKSALKTFNVEADYFKETVLGIVNQETLMLAFEGDLSQLNSDTRDAKAQGKNTILKEKGFSLLKAVLIHELYIKTTLESRGKHMKEFVDHMIRLREDGSLETFQKNLSLEDQKRMVTFIHSRKDVYTDKKEIFNKIGRYLHNNVYEEFERLEKKGKSVLFNAYLIMKVYQQTTRLDRGDGISFIRIVKDLIDYKY
jgi:hypothetical protein